MDVVRTKIRELGGEVLIDSTPGAGTCAQIRLPLTLAIVSALQIEIAGAPFAIPLDRVERTLRLAEQHGPLGRRAAHAGARRRRAAAAVDGAEAFGRTPTGEHQFVVIVRAQTAGSAWRSTSSSASASSSPGRCRRSSPTASPCRAAPSLADGQIALIVDCDALARRPRRPARRLNCNRRLGSRR